MQASCFDMFGFLHTEPYTNTTTKGSGEDAAVPTLVKGGMAEGGDIVFPMVAWVTADNKRRVAFVLDMDSEDTVVSPRAARALSGGTTVPTGSTMDLTINGARCAAARVGSGGVCTLGAAFAREAGLDLDLDFLRRSFECRFPAPDPMF